MPCYPFQIKLFDHDFFNDSFTQICIIYED